MCITSDHCLRGNKYSAQPEWVNGIRFASRREAKRYRQLLLLARAGEIINLELQPKFPLGTDEAPVLLRSARYPNGRRASYFADFAYLEKGERVVEDTKGMDTPLSKLKRAVVEAQYGIRIVII